jgi:putative salt-induced outer membrane protein YdiY
LPFSVRARVRHLVICLIGILSAGFASAQTPPDVDFRALETELAAAVAAKDGAKFDGLLSPAFVLRSTPDVPRDKWIANSLGLCWGDRFDVSGFEVLDATADRAVVALVITTGQNPQTCAPAVVRSLITDVWQRVGERWLLAVRHSGPAGAAITTQFATGPAPPPRWERTAEVSLVGTGGNSDAQTLGLAGSLVWRPAGWTTEARASFVRSETSGVETARSLVANAREARTLSPRLDAFGRLEYLVNEFAGIDARVSVDAGLGYKAIVRGAHRLRIDAGFGYSHEARLDEADLSSAVATAGGRYEWQIAKTTRLTNAPMLTASLDDKQDWRFDNALAVTTSMTRVFSLKLAHELKFLNAPVATFKKTDTVFAVTLVAKF